MSRNIPKSEKVEDQYSQMLRAFRRLVTLARAGNEYAIYALKKMCGIKR